MTRKVVLDGTHRARGFDESLELVAPFMSRAGITRVADVTGLDHVGIPVFAAIRPNGRSLSISNGKGLSSAAARVSAIMEAVEFFHAEEPACSLRMATVAQLSSEARVCELERLPAFPRLSGPLTASTRLLWCEAELLESAEMVFVPYELVHLDLTLPAPPQSGIFPVSSNGLASGNVKVEATLHALTELIERDARTLFFLSSASARSARRLLPSSCFSGKAGGLLEKFERAGIALGIWDITTDIGVPCVLAAGLERSDNPFRRIPLAYGSGCHLDRDVALCRALTEVAQTRLTNIAGARDDVSSAEFEQTRAAAPQDGARSIIADALCSGREFSALPSFEHRDFEQDVSQLRARLASAGLRGAAVVDLSRPGWPCSVVRVIVPGLEPLIEMSRYVPGPRGRDPSRHLPS